MILLWPPFAGSSQILGGLTLSAGVWCYPGFHCSIFCWNHSWLEGSSCSTLHSLRQLPEYLVRYASMCEEPAWVDFQYICISLTDSVPKSIRRSNNENMEQHFVAVTLICNLGYQWIVWFHVILLIATAPQNSCLENIWPAIRVWQTRNALSILIHIHDGPCHMCILMEERLHILAFWCASAICSLSLNY